MGSVWTEGDRWTVAELLDRRLDDDADGVLFDVNGDAWTTRAMVGAANRFANTMADFGVVKGDRIATLVENSSEAVVAQYGAVQSGAVGVPINTAYKGEYLRHQLADSAARVLVIDRDVADRAVAIADTI
jgi:carnitine-CoA ligase